MYEQFYGNLGFYGNDGGHFWYALYLLALMIQPIMAPAIFLGVIIYEQVLIQKDKQEYLGVTEDVTNMFLVMLCYMPNDPIQWYILQSIISVWCLLKIIHRLDLTFPSTSIIQNFVAHK